MDNNNIITVPLTNEEHSFLMTVYRKRRKFLINSYLVLVPMVFVFSLKGRQDNDQYVYNLSGEAVSEHVPRSVKYVTNFLLLGSAVFGTGIYIYRTRVHSLKKDADSGVKERVACIVSRKQHFPLTSQYYIWTDSADKPHYEIDQETYHYYNEGDVIYLYRGVRSKLYFENGKYDIL